MTKEDLDFINKVTGANAQEDDAIGRVFWEDSEVEDATLNVGLTVDSGASYDSRHAALVENVFLMVQWWLGVATSMPSGLLTFMEVVGLVSLLEFHLNTRPSTLVLRAGTFEQLSPNQIGSIGGMYRTEEDEQLLNKKTRHEVFYRGPERNESNIPAHLGHKQLFPLEILLQDWASSTYGSKLRVPGRGHCVI